MRGLIIDGGLRLPLVHPQWLTQHIKFHVTNRFENIKNLNLCIIFFFFFFSKIILKMENFVEAIFGFTKFYF